MLVNKLRQAAAAAVLAGVEAVSAAPAEVGTAAPPLPKRSELSKVLTAPGLAAAVADVYTQCSAQNPSLTQVLVQRNQEPPLSQRRTQARDAYNDWAVGQWAFELGNCVQKNLPETTDPVGAEQLAAVGAALSRHQAEAAKRRESGLARFEQVSTEELAIKFYPPLNKVSNDALTNELAKSIGLVTARPRTWADE